MNKLAAYVNEAVSDVENLLSWALDEVFAKGDVRIRASSVADMVNQLIREAKQRKGMYYKIVIQGHGGPGIQGVGDGKETDQTGTKSLWINKTIFRPGEKPQLVGGTDNTLKPLREYLAGNAIVTLAGCSVAKGGAGELLLKAVSEALGGCIVQGSFSDQMDWLPGMEGKILRCSPFQCWQLADSSWIDVPGSGIPTDLS